MRKLTLALLLALLPLIADAQTKISALPGASTTPLTGAEAVPVVQAGVTQKATSQQVGFAGLDTSTNNCLTPLSASFVKAFVLTNDGITPTAFNCATSTGAGNLLSWDDNNHAILFPTNSRLVMGASSAGFLAGSVCTGPVGGGVGNCDTAIGFGGTTTGSVFVYRPIVFSSGFPYLNTSGQGFASAPTGTCTVTPNGGGTIAGELDSTASQGSCTIIFHFSADQSIGNDGFICRIDNETTPTNVFHQTAHTGTSCTLSGATTSGDKLLYTAIGY